MRVSRLMKTDVATCRRTDPLATAARRMYEADCGALPVVDEEWKVVGMVTDRDACMAAMSHELPMSFLLVDEAMAHRPRTVHAADSVQEAERVMREAQVRRLPVVDAEGRLAGILTVNDLVLEASTAEGDESPDANADSVENTLAAICRHRE